MFFEYENQLIFKFGKIEAFIKFLQFAKLSKLQKMIKF